MNLHMPTPHFLYLLSLPSYSGKDRSKIGVSIKPEIRATQLRHYCGGPSDLYEVWEMPDRQCAFSIETEVKNKFTPSFQGKREIFDEPPCEIKEFVNTRILKLKANSHG